MLKLNQIAEKLINYLLEQSTLRYCSRCKEHIDLLSQSGVIFVKIEQNGVYFIVVQGQNFIEGLDTV